jgi:hypothetical protein
VIVVDASIVVRLLQNRREGSSNAMGNFSFEVSLDYRRLERLPRVTGHE